MDRSHRQGGAAAAVAAGEHQGPSGRVEPARQHLAGLPGLASEDRIAVEPDRQHISVDDAPALRRQTGQRGGQPAVLGQLGAGGTAAFEIGPEVEAGAVLGGIGAGNEGRPRALVRRPPGRLRRDGRTWCTTVESAVVCCAATGAEASAAASIV